MPDHELPGRHYTEKQVGLILRRATELQCSEPSARDPAGLTLAELEEVATEVGIDARYLRRAAAELEVGGSSTLWTRLAGAPVSFVLERTVRGELSESAFEDLVPLMQSATIGQGNASAVGKTLTWSSRSDTNTSSQQVLVSSRNGETMVRIEERLGGLAGALFGGILGGVGGGVGLGAGGALAAVLGSAVFAVAFPLVVIGGSYATARAIFADQVRKRRSRMEELMDRIVERVEMEVVGRVETETARQVEGAAPRQALPEGGES